MESKAFSNYKQYMNLLDKTEEEKIVQNLEKDWISFHYQIKQIELLNAKRINSVTKLTGIINLILIIIFLIGLISLKVLFFVAIIWLTILIRKSLNFNWEISDKILSLRSHIQSKEIDEVMKNNFLREYYWLDDIKSNKWEKMLIGKATGKYKKKKNNT